MKLLVTGGAGFIGSNFILKMLDKHKDLSIINYDKLTYAGNPANLNNVDTSRYTFVKADIQDETTLTGVIQKHKPEAIIAFAAESHVDNSILSPQVFLETNILGSETILRVVRDTGVKKLVHISTDEVYGSLPEGAAAEHHAFKPNSPYSASKASGDMLCRAYHQTFGVPVCVVRGSNCYGPRQHPEKLIPKSITNLLTDKKMEIYGDGKNVREWIFTEDFCSGVETVLDKGIVGEAYNLGSGIRVSNNTIAEKIANLLVKKDCVTFVKDRAGHDRRYALDSQKLRDLGWSPKYDLDGGLASTVNWYRKNPYWWKFSIIK